MIKKPKECSKCEYSIYTNEKYFKGDGDYLCDDCGYETLEPSKERGYFHNPNEEYPLENLYTLETQEFVDYKSYFLSDEVLLGDLDLLSEILSFSYNYSEIKMILQLYKEGIIPHANLVEKLRTLNDTKFFILASERL
jgi:hypothetical protein